MWTNFINHKIKRHSFVCPVWYNIFFLKLLNLARADKAFFGQKDYQQSLVVRHMVRDLNVPTEIVVCPIVRESDGLALSSRNAYLSDDERRIAEQSKKELETKRLFDKPIVTPILSVETFYRAEEYHQEYYENNPNAGYCTYVIKPKVEKFRKVFADKLKD